MANEGISSFIPAQVSRALPQEEEGKSKSTIGNHRAGKQFLGSKVEESPDSIQETSTKVEISKSRTRALSLNRLPIPDKPLPPTPTQSRSMTAPSIFSSNSASATKTAPPIPDRATKPVLKPRGGLSQKVDHIREPIPKIDHVVQKSTLALSNSEVINKLQYLLKATNDKFLTSFVRIINAPFTPQREAVRQEILPMLKEELDKRVKEGKISQEKIPSQVKEFVNQANADETAPTTSDKTAQLNSLKNLTSEDIKKERTRSMSQPSQLKTSPETATPPSSWTKGVNPDKAANLSPAQAASVKMDNLLKTKNFKDFVKLIFEKPSGHNLTSIELLNSYKLKMTSSDLFEGVKLRFQDPATSSEEKKALLDFATTWVNNQTFAEDLPSVQNQLKEIVELAESQPALKTHGEKLTQAINKKPPVTIPETKAQAGKPIDLSKIKKGYPKELPQEFADALLKQSQLARQNLDVSELLTKKLEDPKSSPSFAKYAAQSDDISFTISHQIVSEANPKKRATLMNFYTEVANQSAQKGDFNTAFAIFVALNKTEVSRLQKTEGLLSNDTKQSMQKLTELFEGSGNYKNLAAAMAAHSAPIPPAFRLGNMLSGARENALTFDQLKVVSHVLTPLLKAKQQPPPQLDNNQKNILNIFNLKTTNTSQFEKFVKETESKAKAQAESEGIAYKPKALRDHLGAHLYALSLKIEPRKKS